jgi:hypothetical protein
MRVSQGKKEFDPITSATVGYVRENSLFSEKTFGNLIAQLFEALVLVTPVMSEFCPIYHSILMVVYYPLCSSATSLV